MKHAKKEKVTISIDKWVLDVIRNDIKDSKFTLSSALNDIICQFVENNFTDEVVMQSLKNYAELKEGVDNEHQIKE